MSVSSGCRHLGAYAVEKPSSRCCLPPKMLSEQDAVNQMKCRQGMSRSPIKATDEVLLLAKVPNDGELAQLETRVFWRR